jgi:chromosome segregation ATPase
LATEMIEELERKIDTVIERTSQLKEENVRLREELDSKNEFAKQLETEKNSLNERLGHLESDVQTKQDTLNQAAEKIRNLLNKLESLG